MSSKTKRLNVLIYAGTGATTSSVKHATYSLRRLLGPNYAVVTVTGEQILKEPWQASCALLVFPGGADLGYCRVLNGDGNRRIKQYVRLGGAYLGLCAGGYYGSARCEFEEGKREMEVVGDRELGFFPGTCRGLAFEGFVYQSEKGARAVKLKVNQEAFLPQGSRGVPDSFRSYYNGGGVFVDAEKIRESDGDVEIVAEYEDQLAVEAGKTKAAAVFCKLGDGRVILTGPHPEFSGHNLNPAEPSGHDDYPALVKDLIADEKLRSQFMKACLVKLGLEVSEDEEPVPSLSRLHLSASDPAEVSQFLRSWREHGILTENADGEDYINGENDVFRLARGGSWSMRDVVKAVAEALPSSVTDALSAATSSSLKIKSGEDQVESKPQADSTSPGRLPDFDSVVKDLAAHETSYPESKETPCFNHHAYFASLDEFQARQRGSTHSNFGKALLYGEVVTSTNTILEKNPTLLSHLPIGFTATATTQVAGRGRGTNVWVSPPGCLMFSTVLRHALDLSNTAPVVFVQYLAALAIVAAVQDYGRGYEKLPVKLKWPNDIYARDPTRPENEDAYVKIGGILVNSSYAGGDYTLVVGIGVNVNNPAPSTSLSQLARAAGLPSFTMERLLAAMLTHFETLYTRFCATGFDERFEKMYYGSWLHTDQVVSLEMEAGAKARIKGITRDWGQLVAEELDWRDRPTGKRWELQSDSNSFDFFKGLLRKKI